MAFLIADIDLAVATILGEAEGEGRDGQLAVAKVIRNRMRLKFFSDGSVAGTVLWPYQFSLWNTQERRRISMCKLDWASTPVQQVRQVWIDSETWKGLDDESVQYHVTTMNPKPSWALSPEFVRTTAINRHTFYKRAR